MSGRRNRRNIRTRVNGPGRRWWEMRGAGYGRMEISRMERRIRGRLKIVI